MELRNLSALIEYPETNYDLIKEAGVEIEILDKNKIESWAKMILDQKMTDYARRTSNHSI